MALLFTVAALAAFYLSLLRDIRARWLLNWPQSLRMAGALWAAIVSLAILFGIAFTWLMPLVT